MFTNYLIVQVEFALLAHLLLGVCGLLFVTFNKVVIFVYYNLVLHVQMLNDADLW